MHSLKALWTDDQGVMSLETALLVVLVALAGVATWKHLAGSIENRVANTSNHLAGPIASAPVSGSAR